MRDGISSHTAKCKVCYKIIDISTMCTSSLRSHARGQKHTMAVKCMLQSLRLETSTTNPSSSTEPSPGPPSSSSTAPTDSLKLSQQENQRQDYYHLPHNCSVHCSNAETWWGLKVVNWGYFFKSSEDIGQLWKKHFPDSTIAMNISCAETKCMYVACYGIAPYFKSMLLKKLQGEPYILLPKHEPEFIYLLFFNKRSN